MESNKHTSVVNTLVVKQAEMCPDGSVLVTYSDNSVALLKSKIPVIASEGMLPNDFVLTSIANLLVEQAKEIDALKKSCALKISNDEDKKIKQTPFNNILRETVGECYKELKLELDYLGIRAVNSEPYLGSMREDLLKVKRAENGLGNVFSSNELKYLESEIFVHANIVGEFCNTIFIRTTYGWISGNKEDIKEKINNGYYNLNSFNTESGRLVCEESQHLTYESVMSLMDILREVYSWPGM